MAAEQLADQSGCLSVNRMPCWTQPGTTCWQTHGDSVAINFGGSEYAVLFVGLLINASGRGHSIGDNQAQNPKNATDALTGARPRERTACEGVIPPVCACLQGWPGNRT